MVELQIDQESLRRIFSVVLVFDSQWSIENANPVVEKYLPSVRPGTNLTEWFTIYRPANIENVDQLRANLGALFLLVSHDKTFAIRGQVIQPDRTRADQFCFLGGPWLAWMNANRPDVKLSMADFSKQDAQLDQLFLMATEKNMVSDLEGLNTDLKAARDEAESANRAKSDFFSVMSHEMRTPLNGVVSAISLLEDSGLDAEQGKLAAMARNSSQDLMLVLNYALDSAKAEAGGFNIESEDFDIAESVELVLGVVRPRAVEKGIALTSHIASDVSRWVRGDSAKLRQVLLNLVSNAAKFTQEGQVEIRISAKPGDGGASRIRFEVEDTGCGIAERNRERVFDAFWSSNMRLATAEAGTGLGLDISRRLVELLHGDIGFDSEYGKGSTFWFEVPLEPVSPAAQVVSSGETVNDSPITDVYEGRVLLVDDNQTNLLLGKMILEKFGVRVETVSDGTEAVDMVTAVPFDLVLMDITMPVMDGLEATRLIRMKDEHASLPIVALTAHAFSDERKKFLEQGMNDCLVKPMQREELARVLAEWLGRGTSRRSSSDAGNELPAEGNRPEVDRQVLQSLFAEIGAESFSQVLPVFLGEIEAGQRALQSAWETRALGEIARHAHTLSSSMRSFGASRLGEMLTTIELAAKAGSDHVVAKEMERISQVWMQTIEALQTVTADMIAGGERG